MGSIYGMTARLLTDIRAEMMTMKDLDYKIVLEWNGLWT
jgi:hypothetical protein